MGQDDKEVIRYEMIKDSVGPALCFHRTWKHSSRVQFRFVFSTFFSINRCGISTVLSIPSLLWEPHCDSFSALALLTFLKRTLYYCPKQIFMTLTLTSNILSWLSRFYYKSKFYYKFPKRTSSDHYHLSYVNCDNRAACAGFVYAGTICN